MEDLAIRNICFLGDDSDLKFIFENEEERSSLTIPVHSFVLKKTSRVFKTMLENKKFIENRTGEIHIFISGPVNVGMFFVRYLYTRVIPKLELDMHIMLLQMGRMYEVTGLAEMCEKKLWSEVDPFSVCRVYQTLEGVASVNFLGRCLSMMKQSAFLIFMHNRHLILCEKTMKLLLEANSLTVLDEEQTVEAVWQWGLVKCFQENKPGNVSPLSTIVGLLPYIRWGRITSLDASCPWSLLIKQQKKMYLLCPARGRREAVIALNKYAEELNFVSKCERQLMMSFKRDGNYQLLLFSTSVDVILSGFTFVIGLRVPSTIKKNVKDLTDFFEIIVNKVEISDNSSSKLCPRSYFQMEEQKFCNYTNYRIEVELLKPMVMEKCCVHIIDMRIKVKNSVAFPQFILNQQVFPLSPKDVSSVLNVQGKVASLTSIFYFIKF